jgi:hypothetical protein
MPKKMKPGIKGNARPMTPKIMQIKPMTPPTIGKETKDAKIVRKNMMPAFQDW